MASPVPISLRFINPLPIPETLAGGAISSPTILQIAPCLGETGKRLLDAGELYQLFLALTTGTVGAHTISKPGNIVLEQGTNFVSMRQAVPQSVNITLPAAVLPGYTVLIKDALGACSQVVYTVNTRDGTLIDLQPTFNISIAFQSQTFVFDGIGWTING